MNKKLIKKIILVLFVLLVIMLVILIYILKENNNTINDNSSDLIYSPANYEEDEEYPFNYYKLFMKYKGETSSKEIAKSITRFSRKKIPEYYEKLKNLSNQEIENYFKNNEDEIYVATDITEFEDFKNIINKLQDFDVDELKFESFRIDDEKIVEDIDGVSSILCITYENGVEIEFNIKIYDKVEDDMNCVRYSIVK